MTTKPYTTHPHDYYIQIFYTQKIKSLLLYYYCTVIPIAAENKTRSGAPSGFLVTKLFPCFVFGNLIQLAYCVCLIKILEYLKFRFAREVSGSNNTDRS